MNIHLEADCRLAAAPSVAAKAADSTLPIESSCGGEPQLASSGLWSRFLRVRNWNPDSGTPAHPGTAASALLK